jgi:hypothetical protein
MYWLVPGISQATPLASSLRLASLKIVAGASVKQPVEADFTVQISDAAVEITFKPIMSHYSFPLVAGHRKVSPRARVRHARTGPTDDYALGEVEAMAFRVACAAIKAGGVRADGPE